MSYSENVGLLGRASRLRESEASDPSPEREGDWGSGIDAKDRADIEAHLKELTEKSRISVGTSTFQVKARKKGILMPVIVNLATIAGMALAVLILFRVFTRQEAETAGNGVVLQSTEGRLIAELKKESASQLDAKDRQIADIQERMEELDRQKSDLQLSMEARIKARETELKSAMAAEIEAERQRLLALGLSEAAVQERIRKFEAEKNAEYARKLTAFQEEAEAERLAGEARLADVRTEYEASLAGLADERKKIQADARKREEELRASLDAAAAKLAADNAQNLAGLEAAKAELARLEEQKKKAAGADEKIAALYASVKQALDDRRYADAALQAAALRSYLDDPAVVALSSMATRRPADIFAADSLAQLAKFQLDRASVDTGKLLRQAELLQSMENAIAEGKRMAAAGDWKGAEKRYNEALALVPSIMEAHSYFLGKSGEEDARRQAELLAVLEKAGAAYKAKDWEAMATRYEEALAFLPLSAAERHDIMARVMEAGATAAEGGRQSTAAKAAKGILEQAQKDLKAGNWAAAYSGYLSVLEAYPATDQAATAARGARSAFDGLARTASTDDEAVRKQVADLQARVEALTAELKAAAIAKDEAVKLARTEDSGTLNGIVAEKDRTIADLEAALKKAQEQSLAAQDGTQGQGGTGSAATEAALSALKAENLRLQETAARFDAILSGYARFFPAGAGGVRGAGDATQVYGSLMAFLSDPAMSAAFPGLDATVKGLFLELRADTAVASTKDEVDICLRFVDIMKRYPAQADRDRELRALESEYSRQPALLGLIKEMRRRIGTGS